MAVPKVTTTTVLAATTATALGPSGRSTTTSLPAAPNRPTMVSRAQSSRAAACWRCTPTATAFSAIPRTTILREMSDPFVPGSMIDKFGLREGLMISGMVQPGRRQQGPRLREVLDIDGMTPEATRTSRPSTVLTPINPEFWLRLETGPEPMTTRVMDLLTPLGKGQRALIVPRPGRQDHPLAAHQQRHLDQLSGRQADRPAD